MNYLLACLGSAGDLHPFLALARALRARGHGVELMSNAPYREAVEREGVAFSPLCSERDHQRTASHPDLWHPVRGFGVLWRHLAVPAIEPVQDRVLTLTGRSAGHGESGWRVLASPLAIGARLAREARTFPLASVYTAPANLRPMDDPMFVGPLRVPRGTPRAVRTALWWGLDRWKLEPMARPQVLARCEALGVQPPGRFGSIFGEWVHSPDGGVALYPASFGPAEVPGRPGTIFHGDFPRFRRSEDTLALDMAEFLQGGEAPVVIFGGSQPGPEGRRLLRVAWQAVRALGKRSLLLGPPEAMPEDWNQDERSRCAAHVPLADVLPISESFVHHGGIGSCAEGLAAGIPQVVVPFAYDQFDNAARVERLHAGFALRSTRPGILDAALLAALQQAAAMPISGAKVSVDPTATCLTALERWEARCSR